jgi:hypothetical protein
MDDDTASRVMAQARAHLATRQAMEVYEPPSPDDDALARWRRGRIPSHASAATPTLTTKETPDDEVIYSAPTFTPDERAVEIMPADDDDEPSWMTPVAEALGTMHAELREQMRAEFAGALDLLQRQISELRSRLEKIEGERGGDVIPWRGVRDARQR